MEDMGDSGLRGDGLEDIGEREGGVGGEIVVVRDKVFNGGDGGEGGVLGFIVGVGERENENWGLGEGLVRNVLGMMGWVEDFIVIEGMGELRKWRKWWKGFGC